MNNDELNAISTFIHEATSHILSLHKKTELCKMTIEKLGVHMQGMADRIEILEKENECLKKEMEQISLLN